MSVSGTCMLGLMYKQLISNATQCFAIDSLDRGVKNLGTHVSSSAQTCLENYVLSDNILNNKT